MAGFDISGLNASALSEYAMSESRNASTAALENKLKGTSEHSTDDELWEACKGFEAYFMEQVYKEMQKSVDAFKPTEEDRSTSTLVDFFRNQTVQAICADDVDRQSNGFAQMLYENMKRTYHIPEADTKETAETADKDASEDGSEIVEVKEV